MAIIQTGNPSPLGATWDGQGTNFAVFSEHATQVDVCLFDSQGMETRLSLPGRAGAIWHGYVPGVIPGTAYGFRAHGPYLPHEGQRFNPNKLLLDPYARAIQGQVEWSPEVFGYRVGGPHGDLEPDARDSAAWVPKSLVHTDTFDWEGDQRPNTPLHRSILYEAHVKGLTQLHPDVPSELRGTYAGLASPAMIDYLTRLGITAIELLPVHQFIQDSFLHEKGLRNYWGYNSIGFFAPHNDYSSSGDRGGQVDEFKQMVKALHRAGIEVILDVVYNHTAESHHNGPTLSFRGLDNRAYYWLNEHHWRYYRDFTGTGNSINANHPVVLQMIFDSLRYWVEEMHVDGFRFDLVVTLGRTQHGFNSEHPFFQRIRADEVLSQVKLIAEPWDIGEWGYQLGGFPAGWSEWNDRFRDTVRDIWGRARSRPYDLVRRFTGSPDLYRPTQRSPLASINLITAHDGFTLHDVVSYRVKHNQANLEDNRDGHDYNHSENWGVEGLTHSRRINRIRARQVRNMLATLLLSQGVPMLLAGDEIGNSQQGNNNAYCQDNEIGWLSWPQMDAELLAYVQGLIRVRKSLAVFQNADWLDTGDGLGLDGSARIEWRSSGGRPLTPGQLDREPMIPMQARLYSDSETVLVLFNPTPKSHRFRLPGRANTGHTWQRLVTSDPETEPGQFNCPAGSRLSLKRYSLQVWQAAG
jgi:glycogen operon protein